MNPNSLSSAPRKENVTSVQPNTGQTPFTQSQFNQANPNMMQQFRPRMDVPHSNERNAPVYQQPISQQRNVQQSYQQIPRFPGGENSVRFPPNSTSDGMIRPNGSNQNFAEYQKSSGSFLQGPRMQMGPQSKFQGPQVQAKPPVNNPNIVASNQMRPTNFQQMDPARPENHNILPNKTPSQVENDPRPIQRDQPPVISRKNSVLNMSPSSNDPKLIRSESKSHLETKLENNVKSMPMPIPKDPPRQVTELTKSEEDKSANEQQNKEGESVVEVTRNYTKSNKKPSKINGKEIQLGKSMEDDIKRGLVLQNIKFFESNDTAKTPLVPQEITQKKKERKAVTSPDVVKCEFHEDKYESGVDETPMVYPNLGSIFEAPRRVAKIPTRRVGKLKSDKKSRPVFQVLMKSRQGSQKPRVKLSYSHLPYKAENSKVSKIKNFGPDEELLAFFESSNSWKKSKRYVSSRVDHNAVRNKLENKPKANGDVESPKKTPSKLPAPSKKNQPVSPARTPLKSPGTPGALSLPKTPDGPAPSTPLIKKVPMNKIQVGAAPSPNLKTVKSKIGSLANTTHKPGGGQVKIESHKIDLSNAQPRIEAKNDQYKRSGGDKKIQQVKLQWAAKPKIGSLENATYKPGGGDKKIESVKLDFKEKAKPKVGSKDNVKHVPGGGNVKIENQKLEFKAQSKVGSLDNVKHKPGGGDVKIFDDKTYLRQISGTSSEGKVSGTQSYGDLFITREDQGRSAPGTPGGKRPAKIKKSLTIDDGVGIPLPRNTEVTPKKVRNVKKSPEVQLTADALDDFKTASKIIKIKTNNHAPVLKTNLSNQDVFDVSNEKGKKVDFDNSSKDVRTVENLKQSSASSNLSEGKVRVKDDRKMTTDSFGFTSVQEKIGETWKERDTAKDEFYERQQKQSLEITSAKYDSRPLMSQSVSNNFQKSVEDPQMPHYYSQQKVHSQEIYQPTPFTQSHQQSPISQQRFPFPPQEKSNFQ